LLAWRRGAGAAGADPIRNITPVTGRDAAQSAGIGLAHVASYLDAWGYSPLEQINKNKRQGSAGRLDLVDDQRRHRDDADRA